MVAILNFGLPPTNPVLWHDDTGRGIRAGDWVVMNKHAPAQFSGLKGKVLRAGLWGELRIDFSRFDLPGGFGSLKFDDVAVDPRYVTAIDPPEGVAPPAAAPDPKKVEPEPVCSFCGGDGATAPLDTGLRCQETTWHVCGRLGCFASTTYHTERIKAGLVDCPETRAATRAWYVAKLEREEREARASRLAAMVP